MPFGTITSTESTFGSISGTIAGAVPGTLSGSVGVPGPVGPVGPVGPQGPQGIPGVGGAWGSIVGTLSAQGDLWSALSSKYDASNPNGFITSTALVPYITSATAASTYQPLSGMTAYLTTASAASTYAPIAAGLPTGGTVGQVLTKNSGTNYDDSWQTLIPGDRYVTTSTTSNTISNGAKTFTVGTGLSYSSQQDVVISFDASNHMHAVVTSYNSGTGVLVVDVRSHTGSGTYSSWTVNVGGTTPLQTVEWGEILGVLGDQGDLATALGNKLETSDAASTYQTIAGMSSYLTTADAATTYYLNTNPDAFITASALTGYATESWVTAQGYITSAALSGYATESWVTSQGYLTSAPVTSVAGKTGDVSLVVSDVSGAADLAGATFTGKVNTIASATGTAGLNLPHGAAPTTPVNGDLWTTTGGLFMRQNGSTQQYVSLGETQTISGNKTFSNANVSLGTSTGAGTINVGTGATISGSTKTINIGTGGVSGSTTNINLGTTSGGGATITLQNNTTVGGTLTVNGASLSLGTSTAAGTIGIGTGATVSGSTRTINIGTASAAGSTNAIVIGGGSGTSTTTLQGTTNGVTVAADTNSTALATTAFVVGQAGSATPLVDGTAAVGTSLRYARQDHVHPTDTSRAALAGATFTGLVSTPASAGGGAGFRINHGAAPTVPANGDVWTTASGFFVNLNGTTNQMAAVNNPTFTGVPAAPTAAVDTNTTQLATTAFVVAQAGSATPLVNGTAAVGTSLRYARQDHVHPTDTTRAPLASPTFTGTVTIPAGASISGFAPLASPAMTGTPTAPTATAGTNTTQIATTAFVQNANLGSDDPLLLESCMEGVTPFLSNTSMTAVAQRANSNVWNLLNYGSAVASGQIIHWFSPFDGQWYGQNGWNFSKAGNAVFYANVGLAAGATQNADCRIFWGRRNTDAVGSNIGIKGFQIRFSTAGGTMTTNFGVHNGTTLTEVSMGNTTAAGFNKYLITWDGAGNFACFRNGVQVATSSAGPTGFVTDSNGVYAGIDYKANTGNTAFHTISYLNSFTMRGAF